MSRVIATTTEDQVEVKTPRKRVASKKSAVAKTAADKTAPKKTAVKKAPRKAAAKKKTPAKKSVNSEAVVEEASAEVTEVAAAIKKRKAPTVFLSEAAKKRAVKTQVIVVGVLLIMGVGASAAVGFTDSNAGQINVVETIKAQNARMANMVDVDGPTVVAPVPNRATTPDAGLIPAADQTKRTLVPTFVPSASSTTTATGTIASSTDDGVGMDPTLDAEPERTNTGGGSAVGTATTTVTAVGQDNPEAAGPDSNQDAKAPDASTTENE
jgi:hypothetical protein